MGRRKFVGRMEKKLRMPREDFLHLVDQFRVDLEPDPNAVRDCLTPEKKSGNDTLLLERPRFIFDDL